MQEHSRDRIQDETLRILQPGNEMLQQMLDRFGKIRSRGPQMQIACFFESKSSEVGAIVGKQERTVGIEHSMLYCTLLIRSKELRSQPRLWLS